MKKIKPVKDECDMRHYFKSLVENKKFSAYAVEMNTEQIIEDTENYTLIRVAKGATLTPTTELFSFYFIKASVTGQMYKLDIRNFDRNVSNCSSFRSRVHACDLERLTEDFNPKKFTLGKRYLPDVFDASGPYDYIVVPKEMIAAHLKVECVEYQIIDLHANFYDSQRTTGTHVTIENSDDKDKIFNDFIEFIQQNK